MKIKFYSDDNLHFGKLVDSFYICFTKLKQVLFTSLYA